MCGTPRPASEQSLVLDDASTTNTWACPDCTYSSNGEHALVCGVCGRIRPESKRHRPNSPAESLQWACPRCTSLQAPAPRCSTCGFITAATRDESRADSIRVAREYQRRRYVVHKQNVAGGGSASIVAASAAARAPPAAAVVPAECRLFWKADSFWLNNMPGVRQAQGSPVVSLGELLQGDIKALFLTTYQFDDRLLAGRLAQIEKVVVMHGMDRNVDHRSNMTKYGMEPARGTHHSKMFIAVYEDRCRVCIHTANHTKSDWESRQQGIWVQDFPRRDDSVDCQFRTDLCDYLHQYTVVAAETREDVEVFIRHIRRFDMTSAVVSLVASVPGYKVGAERAKYGHLRMRKLLSERHHASCRVLVAQSSSTTVSSENWLRQFKESLGNKDGETRVIWPTTDYIRACHAQYPPPMFMTEKVSRLVRNNKNCNTSLYAWKDSRELSRAEKVPHIKTYCGAHDTSGRLSWLLLTSANMGPFAWGNIANKGTYNIGNWEIGVLFGAGVVVDSHHNSNRNNDIVFPLPYLLTGSKYMESQQPYNRT